MGDRVFLARAARAAVAVICLWASASAAEPGATLRICADANHLPYSNAAGEGFENHLAEQVASAMGRSVAVTWWPQRRGFLRNTLDAGACDVVVGVPASYDRVLTTEPYYQSCYAWVFRADESEPFGSLDDPGLGQRRIGVHLIGDDYTNSPPAHALAERGLVEHVVGDSVFGDYGAESPLREPVDAVARGEIDAAILWGPIAGYFAAQQSTPLRVVPIPEVAGHVFAYPIAMGVRRGDVALRDELDRALLSLGPEVAALLARFRVPRCGDPGSAALRGGAALVRVAAEGDPVAAVNPYTGDGDAIAAGARLFRKLNCYACHGAAGGGGMGPDLTDASWKNGDGGDADLLQQILEGRSAMPPYKDIIGDDEAWQLIAFIRTLYKGDPGKKTW
jgi:quinoprotein dehydrogenase-associated probable ABC transporter substrate-binding protein